MSYNNVNCSGTATNCVSGCCQLSGQCATLSSNCVYTYSDFQSNPSKYYFPGQSTEPNSNNLFVGAKKRRNNNDNNNNSGGGSGGDSEGDGSTDGGIIAGAVAGGVILLVLVIGLVVWWKKRQAAQALQQLSQINTAKDNQGTTIILENNTPQPVYGISQPMAPYSQPIAVNPPVYQPMYSQPTFGMGVQPQPGPIIY